MVGVIEPLPDVVHAVLLEENAFVARPSSLPLPYVASAVLVCESPLAIELVCPPLPNVGPLCRDDHRSLAMPIFPFPFTLVGDAGSVYPISGQPPVGPLVARRRLRRFLW